MTEPAINLPAQRLLSAAKDELLERGLGDGSLRDMASRLGTSHRMLIYHFGSADGFWNAVLTHIRHEEVASRPLQAQMLCAPDVESMIMSAWERYSAPEYLPVFRLLFDLYGRAVHDRARFQNFLDDAIISYVKPLTQVFISTQHCSPEQAGILSRLVLAAMRGLLLDLITTGDQESTTASAQLLARMMANNMASCFSTK